MGIHTYTIDYPTPPAVGQYSQPIILKVSKAKGPPGDHFHLVVEALGGSIALVGSPHHFLLVSLMRASHLLRIYKS